MQISASVYAEPCQKKLDTCLELEQECFNNYTKAVDQLKQTQAVNDELIQALNDKKKQAYKDKLKIGFIVGGVCITVGITLGIVAGVYMSK